jgi:ABC-type transporter Mla MlaB component
MSKSQTFTLAVAGDRLRVEGALDFTAAAQMSSRLRQCIDDLPASFTIDLSGLSTFNSAVLAFMLDCVRLSSGANKQCKFQGASPELGNLLQMASLRKLVDGD